MGWGITKKLLDGQKDTAAGLPDKRGASNGRKYGIADFVPGAFASDFSPLLLSAPEPLDNPPWSGYGKGESHNGLRPWVEEDRE
jgi:hypothetical protein